MTAPNLYGCHETNPVPKGYHDDPITGSVYWTEPGLKITRLRLLSDPGFGAWDVSYCDGVVRGKKVAVQLPFSQLARNHRVCGQLVKAPSLARQIIAYAQKDGLFAKKLGILDCLSTLC